MSGCGKEMMVTQCHLRDILKKCENMYEKSKAMCEAACQQAKEIENLMMSLCQEVQLVEDVLYNRVDTWAGSLTAEHSTAGVAGKDHDEPLGNGVTDNLDSNNPVKMISKTSSSLTPTEHEVSPVEVEPLPGEDAIVSDCAVVLEMNETDHFPIQVMDETDHFPVQIMDETDHFPIQVSDPLLLETYSFSALRLTGVAIARITSHANGLSRNPFQPMPISSADVIVESVEINVFRFDRAEELLN